METTIFRCENVSFREILTTWTVRPGMIPQVMQIGMAGARPLGGPGPGGPAFRGPASRQPVENWGKSPI